MSRPSQAPSSLRPRSRFARLLGGSGGAAGALVFAAAGMPAQATVQPASTYAYGINNQQKILEIDLLNRSQNVVFDAAPFVCAGLSDPALTNCQNSSPDIYGSNNFAFDPARNYFYFVDFQGNLRYWDRSPSSSLPVIGLPSQTGLSLQATEQRDGLTVLRTSTTANAAYYNDAFWYFFASNTALANPSQPADDVRAQLVKVSLGYGPSGAPSVTGFERFTIADLPTSGTDTSGSGLFSFGDISIDRDNGELYGATFAGSLFRVDVDGCGAGVCPAATVLLDARTAATPNPSLQITFNGDYSVLFGTTFSADPSRGFLAGGWGTVDLTTGVYSPFSDPSFVTTPLRDIGGSATTSAVPGPLPLLGAGSALAWSRRLRRRSRGPSS